MTIKNRKLSFVSRCSLTLGGIALLVSPLAFSVEQSVFDLSLQELMNLEVKAASLFEEERIDAAASVQTIDAQIWRAYGDRTQQDPLAFYAGIQSSPTFFGGNAMSIRGYSNFLSVRGVSTLIDGVAVNDIIFGSANYDNEHTSLGVLDSIEVIKGPGSTLYGTDAFHGVLAFNTFKHTGNYTRVESREGNQGFTGTEFQLSRGLFGQTINIAFDQRILNDGRWPYENDSENANTPFNDDRDVSYQQQSVSIKLHQQDQGQLGYEVSYYRNGMEGSNFVGGGERFGYQNQDISSTDHSLELIQLQSDYDVSDTQTIGVKASSWRIERDNMFEISFGQFEQTQKINRHSVQVFSRMEWPSYGRLYVGLERSEQKVDVAETNGAEQPEEGVERTIDSVFAQGRILSLFANTDLELGVRIDDYSDFGEQVTPRLSLIHKLNPNQAIKFIYGNAFRAAVALELEGSTAIKGNRGIRPEELNSYELVWFYQEEGALYEVTGFYTDWQDGIISVPITDPVYTAEFTNSGENTSSGIELSLSKQIQKVNWGLKYTYVESENITQNTDYFAYPKHHLALLSAWSLSASSTLNSRLLTRDSWRSTNSDESLATYWRWDVSYQYEFIKQGELVFALKNVLDQENRIPSILDRTEGEEDLPRTLDVSMAYRF